MLKNLFLAFGLSLLITPAFANFTQGAGGSDTSVQYNKSGGYAGDSNLIWNYSTGKFVIKNVSTQTASALELQDNTGVRYLWAGPSGLTGGQTPPQSFLNIKGTLPTTSGNNSSVGIDFDIIGITANAPNGEQIGFSTNLEQGAGGTFFSSIGLLGINGQAGGIGNPSPFGFGNAGLYGIASPGFHSSIGSPTTTANTWEIGVLAFAENGLTNWGASVRASTDKANAQNIGISAASSNNGSGGVNIAAQLSADGSSSDLTRSTALSLNSNGSPLIIGEVNGTPEFWLDNNANAVIRKAGALTTSATNGWLYLSSSAGTPSGTPTTFTGNIPIQIDSTNGQLDAYFGSAWNTVPFNGAYLSSGAANVPITITANASQTANMLVIQDSTAANKYFTIGPPTLPASTATFLSLAGTFPSTLTSQINGAIFSFTGAGSSGQLVNGLTSNLLAGYTGSAATAAISSTNSTAGSGSGASSLGGNFGGRFTANGAESSGFNYGVGGDGLGSHLLNAGGVFRADMNTNTPAVNVGVIGFGLNATTNIGGAFYLRAVSGESFTPCALLADNGTASSPVFLGQVNGVTKFAIDANGNAAPAATQTVVNGSSSGNATFSEPLTGSSDKEVIIYCAALNGTASYSFPTAFVNTPVVESTTGLATGVVTTLSTTGVTVTGAPSTGFLFVKGY